MSKDILEVYEPLHFDYPELKSASEDAFNYHIKLYEGYIKKLNEINCELKTVNKGAANHNYSHMRELLIEKTHNFNSIILHEMFFDNLTDRATKPSESFKNTVEQNFGTWDEYTTDLEATAKSARAGWAITTINSRDNKIQNFAIDLHDFHVPIECKLLTIIDVWEHAYTKDFEIDKPAYIEATLKEINWDKVSERHAKLCCK